MKDLPVERRQFVCEMSPIDLGQDSPLRRTSPRPPEFQQEGYAERFDWTHLFYDVFWDDGRLILIGPPLRNLASLFSELDLALDGQSVAAPRTTVELDRMSLTHLDYPTRPGKLRLAGDDFEREVAVQPAYHDVFAGKNVVVTMSRDNDLVWIKDWAEWYARLHGVNGAIIYDNGSTRTEPREILEALQSLGLLDAIAIVPCPFPFGIRKSPAGGSWDSDYLQYVKFVHAHRRFLKRAQAFINVDIDELVVSEGPEQLLDALKASRKGVVTFAGHWVANIPTDPEHPARHREYVIISDRLAPPTPLKWAMDPSRLPEEIQPLVHGFSKGFTPKPSGAFKYRHFRGVNTGWKWNRSTIQAIDPDHNEVDRQLVENMTRIGWRD